MNGDQRLSTPKSEQHTPVDNPPSLSEPSQRPQPIPALPDQRPTSLAADKVAISPSQTAPMQASAQPSVLDESNEAAKPVDATSFYHPEDDNPDDATTTLANNHLVEDDKIIEWISSGEDLRARAVAWRMRMTLLSLAASAIIYLLTRDIVSAGSVGVVGLLFGILGSRKPPSLTYMIDRSGITIGRRHYTYNEFRAFTVPDDPQTPSINLIPLKRFLPLLSLRYDTQQRDEIIDMLALHLPMETHKRDAIDSIINRVKF